MRGTSIKKMDSAKTAIKEVIKTIPQSTQIGLLVFGGRANGWVFPLGPRNDAKLVESIDRLGADGGTPLGRYMKMGADRLLEERKAQYGYGSYRLLIVTDGEANDAALVEKYTPDIMARGIVTDVIGVDMAGAHTLATKVHSYRRANDPASLKQAIQEVFAEVGKEGNNQAGESAFEELSGLPDEMAMAIINALVSSGNHPIGTAVKTAAVTADAPAQRVAVTPPASGNSKPRRKKSPKGLILLIVAVVVVISYINKHRNR
jgi:hypothetical protein